MRWIRAATCRKVISITYSECVFVTLGPACIVHVIQSSVACSTLWCFSMLSHKWHHFQKNKLLNIICVFWFALQLLSETFLILKRTERGMIINVYWSTRHLLFLSDFNELCLISTYFGKILIYKFHVSMSSGSELFHAGWQTDRNDKANCHYSQFCERA